jgi:hypothetical protein
MYTFEVYMQRRAQDGEEQLPCKENLRVEVGDHLGGWCTRLQRRREQLRRRALLVRVEDDYVFERSIKDMSGDFALDFDIWVASIIVEEIDSLKR